MLAQVENNWIPVKKISVTAKLNLAYHLAQLALIGIILIQ